MDWSQILVSTLSLIGTIAAVVLGNRENKKFVEWRLDKIEKKLDAHNHFAERLGKAETSLGNACQRIDRLEDNQDVVFEQASHVAAQSRTN